MPSDGLLRPVLYYIVGNGNGRWIAWSMRDGSFHRIRVVNREEDAFPYRDPGHAADAALLHGWQVFPRVRYE